MFLQQVLVVFIFVFKTNYEQKVKNTHLMHKNNFLW